MKSLVIVLFLTRIVTAQISSPTDPLGLIPITNPSIDPTSGLPIASSLGHLPNGAAIIGYDPYTGIPLIASAAPGHVPELAYAVNTPPPFSDIYYWSQMPEPSSFVMLGTALVLFGAYRYGRRSKMTSRLE